MLSRLCEIAKFPITCAKEGKKRTPVDINLMGNNRREASTMQPVGNPVPDFVSDPAVYRALISINHGISVVTSNATRNIKRAEIRSILDLLKKSPLLGKLPLRKTYYFGSRNSSRDLQRNTNILRVNTNIFGTKPGCRREGKNILSRICENI